MNNSIKMISKIFYSGSKYKDLTFKLKKLNVNNNKGYMDFGSFM
jgi:hypothetical protein